MNQTLLSLLPLSLALSVCLNQGAAQAQSSYVLTALKSPSARALDPSASFKWVIDPKDQVMGRAPYYSFISYDVVERRFVPVYTNYIVRWPATTAASVSPAKLHTRSDFIAGASSTGGKILLGQAQQVFDTATRKVVASLPLGFKRYEALNDAQVVVWNSSEGGSTIGGAGDFRTGTWQASQGLQPLPQGTHASAEGSGINAAGTVAGSVFEADETAHAALWSGGQLQLLDSDPAVSTRAWQINDAGQVLISRYAPAATPPVTYSLWFNGAVTPLLPGSDNRQIWASALSNTGLVAGSVQIDDANTRAFIWRNGVFSDLTTLAQSKGAKLPAGAVLTEVRAINDKGSVVATMKDAKGAVSLVRLTAKP